MEERVRWVESIKQRESWWFDESGEGKMLKRRRVDSISMSVLQFRI